MVKSHFLCQRWLAVEKDDGLVKSQNFSSCFRHRKKISILDRTITSNRRRPWKRRTVSYSLQTSLSQHIRRTFMVFDLVSTCIESIHTCSTFYLLFRFVIHFNAFQYFVLRSKSIFVIITNFRFLIGTDFYRYSHGIIRTHSEFVDCSIVSST